jgi:hypothetical protein
MAYDKLKNALLSVDWNTHIKTFLDDEIVLAQKMAQCNLRLAIWAKQFEKTDKGNPALPFIREMQFASFDVVTLTALSLYKPAAAAMRTLLENALYYTYFRQHPAELATLVRNTAFYVEKSELLDYHKIHTPNFIQQERAFGLIDKLNKWYKEISSLTHGQKPGEWRTHTSLAEIQHVKETLPIVVDRFATGVEIVHDLFLCTVAKTLWQDFSSQAKRELIKGISGENKKILGLDAA